MKQSMLSLKHGDVIMYYRAIISLKGEDIMETQTNKPKKLKRPNKIIIGIIISVCTLLVIYFGMAIYFMNHFYFGSAINYINVSGKTVEQVKEQIPHELESFTLTIKERGGKKEQIGAADIGLKPNSIGQVQDLKDNQNSFKWVAAFFNTNDYKMKNSVLYDKELLKKTLDKISSNTTIEPKNPSFQYTDNGYVIVDEVKGNKINKDVLYDQVGKAILNDKTTVDLESLNCYVTPEYTSSSQKVLDAKNTLNKYVSSKITYTFGDRTEVVDGSLINKWINIDENFGVTLDEKKIKSYFLTLSSTYDTIGKTRDFMTTSGKTIKVSGGDYGWSISSTKETQNVIAAIKEGQSISKEPAYIQTAVSHTNNDIGNTYVEIDMSKQHLWFYKNGSLVVQGDVVTGNVSSNHATPVGVYKVKYKEKDTSLKGQDYNAPVSFWMPFNGGIGIHDASWRSVFGGVIYKTGGSHGCINAPYNLAQGVFNNISAGNPVVCYY